MSVTVSLQSSYRRIRLKQLSIRSYDKFFLGDICAMLSTRNGEKALLSCILFKKRTLRSERKRPPRTAVQSNLAKSKDSEGSLFADGHGVTDAPHMRRTLVALWVHEIVIGPDAKPQTEHR